MFRLGEKAYHIVYNNCEHLANYIMTGNPKCEQIKQSSPFKKGVAETLDMITSEEKSNFLRILIDTAGSTVAAQQFVRTAKTCCEAAETAGKYALRKTAFATGVLTVAVEAGFAAWQINNLRKMKKAGKIQDRDFKREKAKVVVTVPVVSSLTVAGSVIGQALCPVPGIGACLGGLVANCIGRWGAGVVTGRFFDWWWP
ncbi:unnamed protein product [Mytilus coruscus]|uniref:LRAT domain-containing protein n=1 Tax=Mytilus coruscus TaxID=42192 RepID=A0A6J8CI48_MYTCO|nr:unnamed protein product [Mytilus coruscus]